MSLVPTFYINKQVQKKLFVVDNFYYNPDEIREFALTSVEYVADLRYYKGLRSTTPFRPPGLKEVFESIINQQISSWDNHGYNGCFQICTAEDPQVYHNDTQRWAAMIYLSPNASHESGTRLHRSKITGARHVSDPSFQGSFSGGFYDSTKFDVIDNVGNIYNRLIIMDAQCIHSAGPYFGFDKPTARLTHLFFFD
jgi:hypothetical protein